MPLCGAERELNSSYNYNYNYNNNYYYNLIYKAPVCRGSLVALGLQWHRGRVGEEEVVSNNVCTPGMLILGLGLGLECSGLGINSKANRHINIDNAILNNCECALNCNI